MQVTDHLGNVYQSISDMCDFYGIPHTTYHNRIKRGMSVEAALTDNSTKNHPIKDHLGNSFDNVKALSNFYNIPYELVCRRLRDGWDIKDAINPEKYPLQKDIVYDHLGTVYDTKKIMCEAYNIPVSVYNKRIKRGWALKDALTTPALKNSACMDHKGNTYPSEHQMCKVYGVTPSVYYKRKHKGFSVYECLFGKPKTLKLPKSTKSKHRVYVYDHLGNKYNSIQEMCGAYSISIGGYTKRIKRGWSIKEALTIPANQKRPNDKNTIDHLGNRYNSIQEMCDAYGVSVSAYTHRIARGYSIEKALTYKVQPKNKSIDHLGDKYRSRKEMCEKYQIPLSVYEHRITLGWTIEKALTTPLSKKKEWRDHNGVLYQSLTQMCEAWNITRAAYNTRLRVGWSLEQILTTPMNPHYSEVTDHLGNKYPNIVEMTKTYGIKCDTYEARIEQGWTIEKALTTPIKRKKEDHIGETNVSKCGLKMSIIELDRSHDWSYIVKFEDNSLKYNVSYTDFRRGTVVHPTLFTSKRQGFFLGYTTKYIAADTDNNAWYETEKGGVKSIMTPQMMMEHEKTCL